MDYESKDLGSKRVREIRDALEVAVRQGDWRAVDAAVRHLDLLGSTLAGREAKTAKALESKSMSLGDILWEIERRLDLPVVDSADLRESKHLRACRDALMSLGVQDTEYQSMNQASPIGLRAHLDAAFSLASIAAEPDIMDAIGNAIAIMDGDPEPEDTECKSVVETGTAENIASALRRRADAERGYKYASPGDLRFADMLDRAARALMPTRDMECRSFAATPWTSVAPAERKPSPFDALVDMDPETLRALVEESVREAAPILEANKGVFDATVSEETWRRVIGGRRRPPATECKSKD